VGMVGSGVIVGGAGVSVANGVALGARVAVGVGMIGVAVSMAGPPMAGEQAESKMINKVSKMAGFMFYLPEREYFLNSVNYKLHLSLRGALPSDEAIP